MAEPYDTLLQVQEYDTELDQLHHRIEALPERVAQAMQTLKQALLLRQGSWNDAEAERIAKLLEQAAYGIIDGA